MVLTLEKRILSEAVGIVSRFAESKNTTLPVLAGVAIIAGDDGIKFRATNLETAIDVRAEGLLKEPGTVVVPAVTLKEISNSLGSSGSVTLEQKGEVLKLTSGGLVSTLKTLPADDFPSLPLPESKEPLLTLSYEEFQNAFSSILPYASVSTIRPELASVYVKAEGGVLTTVATDSFRLAEKKTPLPKAGTNFTLLIPAKNLALMAATLPNEPITLYADEHQCMFSFGSGLITSRLTQGSYPDYTQIIPKNSVAEATVLKKDFEQALRRTSIFSDSFQKVTLTVGSLDKTILLFARNNDVGETEEKVMGSVSGEEATLSFNHRYLAAPLASITTETITISISGMGRAAIIRGTGDTSFLYLVMPMNQ